MRPVFIKAINIYYDATHGCGGKTLRRILIRNQLLVWVLHRNWIYHHYLRLTGPRFSSSPIFLHPENVFQSIYVDRPICLHLRLMLLFIHVDFSS